MSRTHLTQQTTAISVQDNLLTLVETFLVDRKAQGVTPGISLWHASVQTTERYLGETQRLRDAPGDRLGLHITGDWRRSNNRPVKNGRAFLFSGYTIDVTSVTNEQN